MSTEHEKALNRARQTRWRESNKERARAQDREKNARYAAAHPARIKAFQRRWYLERALKKSKDLIAGLADPGCPKQATLFDLTESTAQKPDTLSQAQAHN